MVNFYPYLIASLPALQFGMKPPFSYQRFLDICHLLISQKDFHVLCAIPPPEQYSEEGRRHPAIQKWIEFDVALRNELVKLRASRKHIDPAIYLRPIGYSSPSLLAAIPAVNQSASLLDAEKALDEIRWKALEDLAAGHYFDLDSLIVYACKLQILQRWEDIRNADGTILLGQAVQHS